MNIEKHINKIQTLIMINDRRDKNIKYDLRSYFNEIEFYREIQRAIDRIERLVAFRISSDLALGEALEGLKNYVDLRLDAIRASYR